MKPKEILREQKKQFQKYQPEIAAYNAASLRGVSLLGALVCGVLTVLSLPFIGVLKLLPAYALLLLFFGIMLALSHWARRSSWVLAGYYVMMTMILLLAAYMGTALGRETNATTFLLVLLLLPLFITDYPWRLILLNVLATAAFMVMELHWKPEGPIRSLDLSNAVVVCGLSSLFVRMTHQRQMRTFARTREENDELRRKNRLINAIPAGIAVFEVKNGEVKQVYTNDGFYRLFEDTRENRLKRTGGAFVNSICPEDRSRLMQAMKSVIDGKDFITLTCRAQKGDGSYMWVRFASSVEKRESNYLRVYSTYTSMEEEMKSREATQAKTEFLSRMSHDMRTPMNGILGLAALSEEETDPAVLRQNIRRIRESGDYLLSLINDTLDFQRIESGKLTLDKRVVNAQRVLDAVLDVVRPTMEQKKLRFSIVNENADMSWNVRLDEMRFKQVLINLLSNAVKFTPEGGEVTFAFGCLGREGMTSHCYIRVSDNGIGMSEEFVRNRLFKPFSQESSAVSPQYVGSGLGLSIVKSLVELMGGRIEVESLPGRGATFSVYLDFERVPREEAAQQRSSVSQQTAHAERRLAGMRVLLAEDHPLNAEIAKRMLAKAGCEATWARDGQECLRQFDESAAGAFDAILMDVRMPVMDGLSAARAIRALARADAKTIPIIAITANAYESDVQNCRNAGMNAHLSKPIDVSQLYQTLDSYVRRSGAKEEGETKHD